MLCELSGSAHGDPRRRAHRAEPALAGSRRSRPTRGASSTRSPAPASRSSTRGRRRRAGARLEKYAVAVGGGVNHRHGLYDAVLVKDNHRAAAGGVGAAVKAARASAAPHLWIQVEVESEAQAEEALAAGADSLLLDNRSVAELRELAARLRERTLLEASGGVTPRERARDRRDRRAPHLDRRPHPLGAPRGRGPRGRPPGQEPAGERGGRPRPRGAARAPAGGPAPGGASPRASASPAPRSGSTSRRCARRGYEIVGDAGRRLPARGVARSALPRGDPGRASRPAGWRGRSSGSTTTDSTNRVAAERARTGAAPRLHRRRRRPDGGTRPPRPLLLLAALPEPLHLDRAAPRSLARPRRRPRSSPPASPSPRPSPRPSATRPRSRSSGRTTCSSAGARPRGS